MKMLIKYSLIPLTLLSLLVQFSLPSLGSKPTENLPFEFQSKIVPPEECRHSVNRFSYVRSIISPDGNIAAYGCPSGFNGAGGVTILERFNSGGKVEWVQRGPTLHGKIDDPLTTIQYEGSSLAFSYNGDILAVGATTTFNETTTNGTVFIYKRQGDIWSLQATLWQENPLTPENLRSRFGSTLALSNDGLTLATTGAGNIAKANNIAVVVFIRDKNGIWKQQGRALQPHKPAPDGNYLLQGVIALSGDGNTIAATSDAGYGVGYTIQLFKRRQDVWSYVTRRIYLRYDPSPGSFLRFARGMRTLFSVGAFHDTMTIFELEGKVYQYTSSYRYKKGSIAAVAVDATGSTIALAAKSLDQTKLDQDQVILLSPMQSRVRRYKKAQTLEATEARINHRIQNANDISISANGKRIVLSSPFDNEANGTIVFFEKAKKSSVKFG